MTSSSTAMATTPTIASSFSPYCCSELSSVVASRKVTMLTPRPASAPSSTGRRLRRFAPSKLAVIAARISTASSPSRKTMIAALVMTVASEAESPSVAAASASFSSSVARVARTSRRGALPATSSASPRRSAAPNQIRPSISAASAGSNACRRRSGPNSKIA